MNCKRINELSRQVTSLRGAAFGWCNWSCFGLKTQTRWCDKDVIEAPEACPCDMKPMQALIARLNAAIHPVLAAEADRLEALMAAEAKGAAK